MKAIRQAELNDIFNSYFVRDEISTSKVTELINNKADEFAIGFAYWCEWRNDRAFRTYEELLEIYKKEKEL